MGFFQTIDGVFRHPSLDAKAKAKIILRICTSPLRVQKMTRALNQLGLQFILDRHPRMLEKPARPYLVSGMPKEKVVSLFCEHYGNLARHLNRHAIETIYTGKQPILSSLLCEMDAELLLNYEQSMEKEGELTLSLMIRGKRVYSAALILSPGTLYIGALQGSKSAIDEIRQFTKTCHGLRPQNFLVFVIRSMASYFGIATIKAVTNDAHIYSGKKKCQDRVRFDYDAFWREAGGNMSCAQFFELSLAQPRKNHEDIVMNKRAMYRRRYEFFDKCTSALREELNALGAGHELGSRKLEWQ